MRYFLVVIFLMLLIAGCADKYRAYRSNYKFRSESGRADYSDLNYWAAHPWKWDPSDSVPLPYREEFRDSVVDVFFLHPTSYTKRRNKGRNAPVDDDRINAKTDYTSILYQASVFNQQSRVFAPRYRQAHISNFFTSKEDSAAKAFEIAYEDVKFAFEYYLQYWNSGKPIIIASHSQGSLLAERLLKEYFDGKPLQNKLVVAYVIGWGLPKEYFSDLKICGDSIQTGCVCAWRTLRKGFLPKYVRKENGNSLVTNPLTWTTTDVHADRKLNKGSILFEFNKLYPHAIDAQIGQGLLYTHKPKFPWSFMYLTRNYHIGDINLYYHSIRENVRTRIGAYWKMQ